MVNIINLVLGILVVVFALVTGGWTQWALVVVGILVIIVSFIGKGKAAPALKK